MTEATAEEEAPRPFFEGAELRFECQRSGNCCRRPGYVYFTASDIGRAAHYLGMGSAAFRGQFLREEAGQWLLDVDPGPCRFFFEADRSCMIHEVKPLQCRSWPLWPELVDREREWLGASVDCPGIGKGPVLARKQVRETVERLRSARIPEGPSIDPQPAREIESPQPLLARRRP